MIKTASQKFFYSLYKIVMLLVVYCVFAYYFSHTFYKYSYIHTLILFSPLPNKPFISLGLLRYYDCKLKNSHQNLLDKNLANYW